MEEQPIADQPRSSVETATRALALFAVVGLALGADREAVMSWLQQHDLWRELAPSEAGLIDTPDPTRKQIVNASWLSERLIVIVWALGHVDELPPPDEQCDPSIFQAFLPPFASVEVADFLSSARIRPSSELIAMADEMLSLHWEARDARIKRRPADPPVDLEIIQERHHAINWLIGYDGADWDEVTTDT
jgi:hypothetical protein